MCQFIRQKSACSITVYACLCDVDVDVDVVRQPTCRLVLSVGYGIFVGYGNAPYPTNFGICRVRNVSKSKSKSKSKPKPKPNSLLSKTLGACPPQSF